MSNKKKWDLASPRSLAAAAEWLRGGSEGIVVMVIRAEDFAFAVSPDCRPSDAAELVRDLLPQMVEETNRLRLERRQAETRKRAAGIAGIEF